MSTKEDIIQGLKNLGIKKGDTLFLRISYKSIGDTEGGPNTVIDAILETIGAEGTLIATAFPKRQAYRWSFRKITYQPGKNIYTGAIPVLMSKRKGACFSSNPISPFVCIGKNASLLTEYHTPEKHNLELIAKAIEISSPKCLRIGGNALVGTTHIAFSEGLSKNHYYNLRIPEGIYYFDNGIRKFRYQDMSFFCEKGFQKFCELYLYSDSSVVLGKGLIGQGMAVLTDMRKTLEIERKLIVPNPRILLCDNPECLACRSAYSFSDYSPLSYIPRLIKLNLKGKYTRGHLLRDIKDNLVLFLFGRKCQ